MPLRINFTKNAIDDLVCPPGKSEILVYDTDTKGLALRVTKAGGKTFVVVRKVQGKDKRTKIAGYDKRTTKIPVIRETALKLYANYQTEIEKKTVGSTRADVTLSLAFENMLQAKSKLTDSTIVDYRKTFKHLAPYHETALSSIGNEEVLKIHRDISQPKVRPDGTQGTPRERTANKALSLLGTIFKFSIAYYTRNGERLFSYNPVDIMSMLKTWHHNKRSKLRINPVDLPQFILECLAIADSPPSRDVETALQATSAAVLFMLFSGVRPGEIAKIRKEYIDHATRSIIFPKRTSANEKDTLKNGEPYHLVLSDSAYCQILYAAARSKSPYVFSGVRNIRLGESNVRDFLQRIETKTGKHLPRKIMRASFISLAESLEISSFLIKVLCNHDGQGQNVDVTDGYKVAYLTEVRAAINKIEDQIYQYSRVKKDVVCRGFLSSLPSIDQVALNELFVFL